MGKLWLLKINLREIICFLLILTIIIPERNPIFGVVSVSRVMFACLALFIIIQKGRLKLIKLPAFVWVYAYSILLLALIHFATRDIQNHAFVLISYYGAIYILVSLIKTENEFNHILGFIVMLFTVYSIFGIYESLYHVNVWDILTNTSIVYVDDNSNANSIRFGFARSRGAMSVSINNGMLLALALSVALYKKFTDKKLIYSISYILIFINAFLTFSRGVWIEIILFHIFIFLWMKGFYKLKTNTKILAISSISILLSVLFFPVEIAKFATIITEMFDSIVGVLFANNQNDIGTIGNRLELWPWVWQAVEQNVLLGLGYSQIFRHTLVDGVIKTSIEVTWLSILFKSGLLGLAGYVYFQIGCIKEAIKNRDLKCRVSHKIDFNYLMIFISFSYFLAQFSCSANEDLRLYYILIGLMIAYNRIKSKSVISL